MKAYHIRNNDKDEFMNLPEALYTAAETRELDRLAIEEYGLAGATLMQRAGEATFDLLRARWPRARRGRLGPRAPAPAHARERPGRRTLRGTSCTPRMTRRKGSAVFPAPPGSRQEEILSPTKISCRGAG